MSGAPTTRRRWLRRLAILALLLIGGRALLAVALAPGLRAAARAAGFELTLEDLDLDLLDGAFELRGAELRAAGDTSDRPLARVDQLRVDGDLSRLFKGGLHVHRIELDGLRVELVRSADGTWNLPTPTPADEDVAGAEDAAAASDSGAKGRALDPTLAPFPLFPPVTVGALLGQGVVLRLRDERPEFELERELRLDLRATDLGHATRAARVAVHGHGPEWLDVLRLDLDIEPDGRGGIRGAGDTLLSGLEPGALGSLPSELGVEPTASQLDGDARLSFHAAPVGDDPRGPIRLDLAIEDARLRADLQPEFTLDSLTVEVPDWSQAAIDSPRVRLAGLRGRAERDSEGRLVVAGLALVGGAAPSAPEPEAEPAPATGPAPSLVDAALAIEDARFVWFDAALPAGPATVALLLDRVDLQNLDLPLRPDARALALSVQLGLGDDGGKVAISGELSPHAGGFDAQLDVSGEAITLAALEPYLAGAGLRSGLDAGAGAARITAAVTTDEAATTVDLRLTGARFADGERELFRWESAALPSVVLPADAPAQLGRIELEGLALPFERSAAGAWTLAGITTSPTSAVQPLTSALSLERLVVTEALDGGRRTLDVDARGRIDGLVRQLGAAGRIVIDDAEGSTSVELDLSADGIDTRLAGPLVAEAGLTAEFEGASLAGSVALGLASDGALELELADLRYGLDDTVFLALESARFERLDFGGDVPRIGAVALAAPTASIRRDDQGIWHALGLRFAPPSDPAPPAPAEPTDGDAPVAAAAPATTAEAQAEPTALDALPIPALEFGGLTASGGSIELVDALAAGARERRLDFEATVGAFTSGPGASDFEARLAADVTALVEGLELTLEARLDPVDTRTRATIAARSIDAEGLRDFLPPAVEPTVSAFALDAALEARVTGAEDGGLALTASFDGFELRDQSGAPLASVGSASLRAPRLDAAERTFLFDEIVATGLTADVVAEEGGALTVAGLRLLPTATEDGPGEADSDEPASEPAVASAAAPTAVPPPPTVSVERLDLDLGRVTFGGAPLGVGGTPIAIGGSLRGDGPLALSSPTPEELPALGFTARLQVDAAELAADLVLEPFADRPRLTADLAASGVRGERIRAVAPGLMDRVDPDLLGEGRFSARVSAELDLRRRHPLDFDLRDGFGGELTIDDVDWRDATTDERLLGLGALRVELAAYRPATRLVHLALVEVVEPYLRARRTPEGLEVVGLRFPPSTDEPDDGGEAPTPTEPPSEGDEGPSEPAPTAPSGELRIDQVLVSGIDLELTDTSVEPASTIPIDELDVELRQFTTRAFDEPIPLRFSAYLGSGDVDLPIPVKVKGGLIGGIASGLASVVTGGEGELEHELRPLFQELGLSGQLTLAPEPAGWVRTHAVGFELLGLRGWARDAGVEIGGGTVDLSARVRLPGDGSATLDSTTVLTDLSVSEPAGGPISKWLKLPAPLDSVVYLLRNQDGEIRLPLGVKVAAGKVGTGALATAITSTLAQVIADAVASSPLRVTGMLTGMVGLGGDEEESGEPTVLEVEFPAGSAVLEPGALATVRATWDALREDDTLDVVLEHDLGARDLARIDSLVNPSPDACLELADRIERRLAATRVEREAQVAAARAALLAGTEAEAVAAAATLRGTERRIGLAEAALDDLLGRLRPGDDRRNPRRARAGALELAELRQVAVTEALLALDPKLVDRIDSRRPRLEADGSPEIGRTQLTLRRRR